MTRPSIAAAAVLAALLVAGCGGDDKPSREDFAADANAICNDLEKTTNEIEQSDPDSPEEFVDIAERTRSAVQELVSRVEDLETPEGEDGEKAQEWKDKLKDEAENKIIPALDEFQEAAESGDEQRIVEAAQELQGVEANESDELAREIGANDCAG